MTDGQKQTFDVDPGFWRAQARSFRAESITAGVDSLVWD